MGFDVVSPNRIEVFNLPGCALIRVTGTTTTTQSGLSNRAPSASGAGAPPPAAGAPNSSTAPQVATVAPSRGRPCPHIVRSCRSTLVDKLDGRHQPGAAMSDVRARSLPSKARRRTRTSCASSCAEARARPAHQGDVVRLRRHEICGRSRCVRERRAGPAPAPLFAERVTTLSRFHSLPPPLTGAPAGRHIARPPTPRRSARAKPAAGGVQGEEVVSSLQRAVFIWRRSACAHGLLA